MNNNWTCKNIIFFVFAFVFCLGSHTSHAAGFLLEGESASYLGTALAGGAASVEDASTNWYNPAGFVLLKRPTVSLSGNGYFLHEEFTGTGKASYDIATSSTPETGTTKAHIIKALIPGNYFVTPAVNDYLWFGLGVTAPAGVTDKFPNDSLLRYAITLETYHAINVNLNMAWKFTSKVSLGAGLNVMRGDGLEKQNILSAFDASPSKDWKFELNAHGYAFGANFGLLYQPFPTTRIGASYRTQMSMTLVGNSTTNTNGDIPDTTSNPLRTVNFSMDAKVLPPIFIFSVYQQITPCWDVMGTLEYEQWNVFDKVVLKNVPVPDNPPQEIIAIENFNNTLTYALGTSYLVTPKLKLRTGFAYVPSAASTQFRDILIPATSSKIFTIGGRFHFTRQLSGDMSFAHPIFDNAKINHSFKVTANAIFTPINYTTTETGTVKASGNIYGMQLNYDFI